MDKRKQVRINQCVFWIAIVAIVASIVVMVLQSYGVIPMGKNPDLQATGLLFIILSALWSKMNIRFLKKEMEIEEENE